jgi:hypothetical protein
MLEHPPLQLRIRSIVAALENTRTPRKTERLRVHSRDKPPHSRAKPLIANARAAWDFDCVIDRSRTRSLASRRRRPTRYVLNALRDLAGAPGFALLGIVALAG